MAEVSQTDGSGTDTVTTAAETGPPGGSPPGGGSPPIKPPGGGGPPSDGNGGGVIDPGNGDSGTGGEPGNGDGNGDGDETVMGGGRDDLNPEDVDYDTWFDEQDEFTQAMIEIHIAGLNSALKAERRKNKALTNQLQQQSVRLQDAAQVSEQMEEIESKLDMANKKASFFENAVGNNIQGKYANLAWVAVSEQNLFETHTTDGNVDYEAMFAELRVKYPDLFNRSSLPTANAGNGIGESLTTPNDMNALIRSQAGY